MLFSRSSILRCFFCQSPCSVPRDPRNFQCLTCGCWNRFDERGEILSDEPAMHEESLNLNAFAKRASPSKDQLPATYGKGPFCHTCQTNQTLLVNLLSNYLPQINHPEYKHRLEMFPQYKESLHLRYPPVCDSCLPAVEDEIRGKDQMARRKALGGWLKESKGKEKQRRVSEEPRKREKFEAEIIAWAVRGALWVIYLGVTLVSNACAALGYRSLYTFGDTKFILLFITLISLLWTVWDPTYASVRRAQRRGRDVRVRGKSKYIKLQMISWSSRLLTSILVTLAQYKPGLDFVHIFQPVSSRSRVYFIISLALEVTSLVVSCSTLRLQQPPAIRLLDTTSHRLPSSRSPTPVARSNTLTPGPQVAEEPDLLASLSLSSQPILTPKNPIFGRPSLLLTPTPPSPLPTAEDTDADAMDWTPTNSATLTSNAMEWRAGDREDEGTLLRPQRFFAPEKPTGLEGLFERTLLVDDTRYVDMGRGQGSNLYIITLIPERWKACLLLCLVPLAVAALYISI